jgi:hypothetical protein
MYRLHINPQTIYRASAENCALYNACIYMHGFRFQDPSIAGIQTYMYKTELTYVPGEHRIISM